MGSPKDAVMEMFIRKEPFTTEEWDAIINFVATRLLRQFKRRTPQWFAESFYRTNHKILPSPEMVTESGQLQITTQGAFFHESEGTKFWGLTRNGEWVKGEYRLEPLAGFPGHLLVTWLRSEVTDVRDLGSGSNPPFGYEVMFQLLNSHFCQSLWAMQSQLREAEKTSKELSLIGDLIDYKNFFMKGKTL
jgi:hypothetical protein